MTHPDKSSFGHKQDAETALLTEQARLRRCIRRWVLTPLGVFIVAKAASAAFFLVMNIGIVMAGLA